MQYVTLTLDVYPGIRKHSLSLCRSLCQKWGLFFVKPGVKVSGQYCLDMLYYVNRFLAAIKRVIYDNFVIQ